MGFARFRCGWCLSGIIRREPAPGNFGVSLGQVRFKREPPIDETLRVSGDPLSGLPYLALVPEMAMTGQRARFGSLGLVFDQGPFNVQFMLNQIKHDSPAYADSKAGYVLAAYRFGRQYLTRAFLALSPTTQRCPPVDPGS